MNKRATIRRILRRTAAAVASITIGVAVYPHVTAGALGYRVAVAVGSLRQPAAAVGLLTESLFPAPQTVTPPAALAPAEDPLDDATHVDIPVVAPVGDTPPITMIPPPGNAGDGGAVVTKKMDTGNRLDSGIATVNRSGTAVDVATALGRDLSFRWEQTDAPQVLILHTHTTEAYMTYDGGYYNAADRHRTTDHTKSVCAVGEAVRMALAAAGITAIHDTTVHDSPVYAGAYTRSATTARSYLEQYPTIKVVLDLHRDAVMEGSGTLVKPTAVVEGRPAAQMMLITGVVSTAALPHPLWQDNLTFAARLQQALDGVSPDLMRPMNTVASRYNQHLSPGWVLVEVGSEGNTVEEAVYAGQILGRTLAALAH